jgi:hypothetical protein
MGSKLPYLVADAMAFWGRYVDTEGSELRGEVRMDRALERELKQGR